MLTTNQKADEAEKILNFVASLEVNNLERIEILAMTSSAVVKAIPKENITEKQVMHKFIYLFKAYCNA